MWRKSGEEIIAGSKSDLKKRINLIMAIDNNEIIHGHIYTNETIGIEELIDFLKEMLERLDKSNLNKIIFILDNASYHTGKRIKKFVEDNQLKFLFTIPYKSEYNPIELSFNLIKNYTYSSLNSSLAKLKKQIIELLDKEEINKDIKNIYKITLEKYLFFLLNKSKDYDLNKMDNSFF